MTILSVGTRYKFKDTVILSHVITNGVTPFGRIPSVVNEWIVLPSNPLPRPINTNGVYVLSILSESNRIISMFKESTVPNKWNSVVTALPREGFIMDSGFYELVEVASTTYRGSYLEIRPGSSPTVHYISTGGSSPSEQNPNPPVADASSSSMGNYGLWILMWVIIIVAIGSGLYLAFRPDKSSKIKDTVAQTISSPIQESAVVQESVVQNVRTPPPLPTNPPPTARPEQRASVQKSVVRTSPSIFSREKRAAAAAVKESEVRNDEIRKNYDEQFDRSEREDRAATRRIYSEGSQKQSSSSSWNERSQSLYSEDAILSPPATQLKFP
jgi:hypothetical protein